MKKTNYKFYYIFIMFLLLLIFLPYFLGQHRAGDKALDASCKNNLKLIWVAICNYNRDLDCLPDNIFRLVENKYIEERNLKCPVANVHGGMFFYEYKQRRDGSDYEYIMPSSLVIDLENEIPVCYDKKGNHEGKKIPPVSNILYIGGIG